MQHGIEWIELCTKNSCYLTELSSRYFSNCTTMTLPFFVMIFRNHTIFYELRTIRINVKEGLVNSSALSSRVILHAGHASQHDWALSRAIWVCGGTSKEFQLWVKVRKVKETVILSKMVNDYKERRLTCGPSLIAITSPAGLHVPVLNDAPACHVTSAWRDLRLTHLKFRNITTVKRNSIEKRRNLYWFQNLSIWERLPNSI